MEKRKQFRGISRRQFIGSSFSLTTGFILLPGVALGESGLITEDTAFHQKREFMKDFALPPYSVRPRVRFWTTQAAFSEDEIRQEIAGLSNQGFGGVEVVAMEVRNAELQPSLLWGSENWERLVDIIRIESAKRNMSISLTNGPAWPVAMPAVASADDPASLFELTFGDVSLQPGENYNGQVPPRRIIHNEGHPALIAVTAYPVVDKMLLDPDRCIDLTGQVTVNEDPESFSLQFVPPDNSKGWVIFSFWEQPAAQKVAGLYVIDHLSGEGAAACAAYWDRTLEATERQPLSDIFMDSLEYKVAMDWTRGMREIFRKKHNYDIVTYLPFVGIATTFPEGDVPGYKSFDPRLTESVKNDYLETLTDLYINNHLAPLQKMAERHGTTIRCQVAYNKPLSIESSAAAIGIPETEGLGRSAIDGQRQMAAAVHILGKPLYSVECAAEFLNGYGQTVRSILWWARRAWAAGVNSQVLHGAAYSGAFDGPDSVDGVVAGVKWPGFDPFYGFVSNKWNRLVSNEMLRPVTDYMSRMNLILRKTAKVDIAVYRDGLDIFVNPEVSHADGLAIYPDGGLLNSLGYSYDLVSPELLALPQAAVTNRRLTDEGPAYKALVIPYQETMSVKALDRIKELAKAGLPVIFLGDLPSRLKSHAARLKGNSDQDVRVTVNQLFENSNVVMAENYEAVPGALRALGIRPDAEPEQAVDILAQHRSDSDGEFYYLYNYNKVSDRDAVATIPPATEKTSYPNLDEEVQMFKTATFSLYGHGRPYIMDAWSGVLIPVTDYSIKNDRITLKVSFEKDEALLIAILKKKVNAVESVNLPTPESIKGIKRAVLNDWTLTIEKILPPESGSPLFSNSRRVTTGPFSVGSKILPWPEVDRSLKNVSGLGSYKTTFFLEKGQAPVIDLGRVENGISVIVNGKTMSGIDQTGGYVRLSNTHNGENRIEIQVPSTLQAVVLGNYIMPAPFGRDGEVPVFFLNHNQRV